MKLHTWILSYVSCGSEWRVPTLLPFPGHTRKAHFSASPCRQVGLLDWTLAKGICTKVMSATFKLLPKNILWDTLVLFSSSIAPMRCSRRYKIECCGEYWVGTEAADNVREDSVGKTFEQRPASPSKQASKQAMKLLKREEGERTF